MRSLFLACFLLLTSIPSFCEIASVVYYDYSGDYFTEKYFEIDINPAVDSVANTLNALIQLRGHEPHCSMCKSLGIDNKIQSNLVVVGYGPKGKAREFFAATTNIYNSMPLAEVSGELPQIDGAKWHIYFINQAISHYFTDKKVHHWASPFGFLAALGLQNLVAF